MSTQEQQSILTIALLAAFADSTKDEKEHAAIRRTAEGFQVDAVDLAGLYQAVLTKQANLTTAVAGLESPEAKSLAYELAQCVCEANGPALPVEQTFLKELQAALTPAETPTSVEAEVSPVSSADAPLEPLLLKYSILTAALELLPQTAGALAIVPAQMKLVYDIGQRHGVAMDRAALREFAAALGIGAVSQVLETGVRRILSGVLGGLGAETTGNVTGSIAGTAITFATTYALGTVAERYYASGRQMDVAALKEEFAKLVEKAKTTQAQYSAEIAQKARELTEKFKGMDVKKILGDLLQGRV